MEILGVGGAEFIAILIIMLIVAGPKRMIRWAYIMGKYTAKARAMWAESMSYIQKEFDEAGVDIQLPKEPPTRGGFNKQLTQQMNKALAPVTNPVKAVMDETKAEVNQLKQGTTIKEPTQTSANSATTSNGSADHGTSNLGTWSGGETSEK